MFCMKCTTPYLVFPWDNKPGINVPCGKCLPCLQNKRADWSFRLEVEHKHSKYAAFVTLTYSPKYVPDYGVNKKHLQLFMKRLRKKTRLKLRYYAVGEYGTLTGRPHYHLILFNFDGTQKDIQRAWSNAKGEPFGTVHIGNVSQASIMYCTKYVIQRVYMVPQGMAKPFAVMSRQFGIGLWYLTDAMLHWHRSGERNYTLQYGEKRRLPRYFKEKIWHDPEERARIGDKSKWEAIKAERQADRELIKQGYSDPRIIKAEMRKAVYDRISQKIAFTQKL